MANGDRFFGPNSCQGEVTATGSNIFVKLDFTPSAVTIWNTTSEVLAFWVNSMPDASAYKILGSGAGVVGNTTAGGTVASHTHDLQLNTGETVAVTPGTGLSDPVAGIPVACVESIVATVNAVPNTICQMIPNGGTPAILSVTCNQATGVFSFDAGSNVTSMTVNYLTRPTTAVAPVFTGIVHTHTFAGAGGGTAFVVVDGITPGNSGFQIGVDKDINNLGDTLKYIALRSK